ncbi:MAG: VOC family protein [Salinisphaera sp.]|nr:VOC family protein [Salinisphaera sp.]MDN5939669.1 VOC family protein [Salinisphaera sp.]
MPNDDIISKNKRVNPPGFHHVNLKTHRQKEMIDWYCEVLRCRVNFRAEGIAFITNDSANHRIALTCADLFQDDPQWSYRIGLHHTAFEYESLDDLLSDFLRLEAAGILPHVTIDHGLTTSFYYRDPDGNMLELQSDNFGDWAQSTQWLRTSQAFAVNPIGVLVDPQQMIAERNAGVTVDEVHRKAYAGEYPPDREQTFFLPEEMEAAMFV